MPAVDPHHLLRAVIRVLQRRRSARRIQHEFLHHQLLTILAHQQHSIAAALMQHSISARARITTLHDLIYQACKQALHTSRKPDDEQSQDPPIMVFLRSSEQRFVKNFRVTPKLFHDVLIPKIKEIMEPAATWKRYVNDAHLKAYPIERKVATCLWHLAHGGEWSSTAGMAGVAASTVRKYTSQVCHAICKGFAPEYFKLRTDAEATELAWQRFGDRRRLGNIRLALDGSHIPFAPLDGSVREDYKNYKGFTSILVRSPVPPLQLWREDSD